MIEFIETRWARYGKARVYLRTVDGSEVGYVDLQARTIVASGSGHEAALLDCLRRWCPDTGTPAEPSVEGPTLEDDSGAVIAAAPPLRAESALESASRDLAADVAGAAARAMRDEVNSTAPVRNFVARLLGVKTDERAWRVGAKGEEKVGRELAKLGVGWRVLHAVEVGARGSDIDHVVIGPPGIWTLNAKRHPGATAWVGERMVMVNGQRTSYLRNSRHEADRATRLLSSARTEPVLAAAAIVFVDLDTFTVRQMPADVHVTTRRRLVPWLRALPVTTDPAEVEEIDAVARLSATWRR